MESLFFFVAVAFFATGWWMRDAQYARAAKPEATGPPAEEPDQQRLEQLENHVREMRVVWKDARTKMTKVHRALRKAETPAEREDPASLLNRTADVQGTVQRLLTESERVLRSPPEQE